MMIMGCVVVAFLLVCENRKSEISLAPIHTQNSHVYSTDVRE